MSVFCPDVGVGGWSGGTINPSPSTDRQYIDFNNVFLLKGPVLGTGSLGVNCSVLVCMIDT